MPVLIFALLAGSVALAALVAVRAGGARLDALRRRPARAKPRRTLDAAFLFLDMAQLQPAAAGLRSGADAGGGLAWRAAGGALSVLAGLLCAAAAWSCATCACRRARRFDAQLPDLVQALAGASRAGAGVQPALRHLVDRPGPPLSQEFGLMLRGTAPGPELPGRLAAAARRRMPEPRVLRPGGIRARRGGAHGRQPGRHAGEYGPGALRARQHWLGRVEALDRPGPHAGAAPWPACRRLLALVLGRLEARGHGPAVADLVRLDGA